MQQYSRAAAAVGLIMPVPVYAADGPAVAGIPVDFILFGAHAARGRAVSPSYARGRPDGARGRHVLQSRLHGIQDGKRRSGIPRAPASRVGDPHEPAVPPPRVRAPVAPLREDARSRGPAALPAARLEGLLRAARDRVRALVFPRQHRGGADRRGDGAHAFPRQGPHRLPRRDRRRVERGWLGQRDRRYDDDHDVDRRRESGGRVPRLCRGGHRSGRFRDSGGDAAAALFADPETRASAHPYRLDSARHRVLHPHRGDRDQRRDECRLSATLPTASPSSACRSRSRYW